MESSEIPKTMRARDLQLRLEQGEPIQLVDALTFQRPSSDALFQISGSACAAKELNNRNRAPVVA